MEKNFFSKKIKKFNFWPKLVLHCLQDYKSQLFQNPILTWYKCVDHQRAGRHTHIYYLNRFLTQILGFKIFRKFFEIFQNFMKKRWFLMILQYCRDWRATSSCTLDETRGGSFWSGPVVTPSAQQLSFKCEASFKIHHDVIIIIT